MASRATRALIGALLERGFHNSFKDPNFEDPAFISFRIIIIIILCISIRVAVALFSSNINPFLYPIEKISQNYGSKSNPFSSKGVLMLSNGPFQIKVNTSLNVSHAHQVETPYI